MKVLKYGRSMWKVKDKVDSYSMETISWLNTVPSLSNYPCNRARNLSSSLPWQYEFPNYSHMRYILFRS